MLIHLDTWRKQRNDIITGLCVICFLGFGVAAFIVAMLIQRSH